MQTFTDSAKRTWTLQPFTVKTIKDIRKALGFDLGALHEGSPTIFDRLSNEVAFLFDVIWELVKDQAKGIKQDEFFASLEGESLTAAKLAFWRELGDFFLSWRPELNQPPIAENQETASPSGESSTNSPQSQESAPTTTASAN